MEQQPSSIITGSIQELSSLFKTCLDILRNDAEHLIGDEALNELSYFLILKQSEKHIVSGAIDILNLDLYKDGINFKRYGKEKFQKGLECVKFTKLVEYVKDPDNEGTIKKIFDDFIWKEVLSKHPKFKDIFEDGKKSFIKESTTIKKIVLALSSIDFNNYEYDILGEAYEKIFVDAIFGAGGNKKSELGQFFTPSKVKKLLIKLVNPKLKDNGEIESVLDPASGTGGILNTTIKHFKQFVKSKKITDKELRKQLIKNIYGIEIKGKIFNLCLSNMLINTGEILPNVICADSIRKFHNIKVDNIVANPPFSVTITYDELFETLGGKEILDDYIPIKTGGKNSEMLFLQMMIHCLNINGRCASVMLDGQKMYGSASGYDKVREYLMRSCDLHEVILCPPGTFTSTASKTCILFFTKKKERKDVLEIKGTKRILKFCDYHSTTKVKFYDFNPDTEEKNFIKEVGIDEIASKKYSLNYTEYGIEEKETKDVEGIEWKELEKLCLNSNGGEVINKSYWYQGNETLYTCSQNPILCNYLDFPKNKYTNNGDLLLSRNGSGGPYIHYIANKVIYSNVVQRLTIHEKYRSKYIYYYIVLNLNIIKKQNLSATIPSFNMNIWNNVKIPISSLEKQNKIVEVLDNLFTDKYNLQSVAIYYENYDLFGLLLDDKYDIFEKLVEWQDQSRELTKQIEFFKNRQANYMFLVGKSENTIRTLGEVCKVNQGTYIKSDMKIQGDYPVYGGGNVSFYINQYNREDDIIVAKDGVSADCVRYEKKKFFLNHHGWTLICKEQVIKKYMFYYLQTIQPELLSIAKGTAQLGINQENFYKLKIPIPSLEKQKEIIAYCDYNSNIIKQLENEIENNKELAQQFIKGIIKTVTKNELETNDKTYDEENDDEEN
jgi:type I restriction-modification system DNA methylase subunit/restriction endonuclease S subunit